MNNNVESQDFINANQYTAPRRASLCTVFNTHIPAVQESDSDWSDIDITC